METHYLSTFNFDLSENVAYNNPFSSAYIKEGLLSFFPDYTAESHWHEDLEFIVILNGTMTYNVNGQLIHLTDGDGIFVNSRNLHYGISAEHNECHFICILLHPSLLSSNKSFCKKYVEPFIQNTECPFVHLKNQLPWTREILNDLMKIFNTREEEASPFIVQSLFFHIFELLCLNTKSAIHIQDNNSANINTLKSMILFIQEHYSKKIALTDISKAGSCCKSKCSALFKQYLHESPVVYLIKYRLSKSCVLLRNTDLSITEIAFECGFHGTSYFCETFRKYYNTTPLDYKKMQGE